VVKDGAVLKGAPAAQPGNRTSSSK